MIRDTFHSMRQSVSARSIRQASIVVGLCILLSLSMAPVAPVSAQEDGETQACAEGPPLPGQGPGEVDSDEVEVAFTIDESNSMNGSEMDAVKNGSVGLVDRLENPDEAAVVSYSNGAILHQELTSEYQSVRDAINGITISGPTDTDAGIATTHDELTNGTNASTDAEKSMVLFTDDSAGGDSPTAAQDAAQAAKDDGIRIFIVVLRSEDTGYYDDWASSPDDVYYAPSEDELEGIYDEIAGEVVEPVGGTLTIDTRSLFQPGETHEYTVTNHTVLSDGTVETEDVTDEASVNTSNTSLLEADESAAELTATSDPNASAGVVVTAEHEGQTGCVNAIVASASMENLEILPTTWRIGTFLGNWTVFLFIVSIGAGIVGTRIATSFMGLSMMEMVLLVGWFGGYISTGLIMTSVFAVLFIGLNLAANIDYQVQR